MASERTLVFLTGLRWEGDYLKSTVELARELGRRHRVLFVESPAPWKALERSRRWRPEPDRNVVVLQPGSVPPTQPVPPGRAFDLVSHLGRSRVARKVEQALEHLGWSADVVFHAWNPALSEPFAGGRFGQRADVYYSYDDLRACAWKARHGRRAEDALLPRVDAVIATSEALAERHRTLQPCTWMVPNGVDYDAFQAPTVPPEGVATDRPVIGFVGSIDSRVDVPLLARLARTNPQWQVVVAGPVRGVDASPLDGVPNLLRLGPVDRAGLPALVRSFDVGLVPFVPSDFTRALCPLKIYDYLAAGIGVAATPFAPLDEVRDVIGISDGFTDLTETVERELQSNEARRAARQRVAAAASWSARSHAIETVFERALGAHAPKEAACPTSSSPAVPASSAPTPSMP